MRIKGWYRFCSLIICFLFFIQHIYAMMLSANALNQAASLLSRACLGINACRTRTDLEYIQHYLQKHQIKPHKPVYSSAQKSWEYLQLVSDTNKLLAPCGYTLTYEMLSHTPSTSPINTPIQAIQAAQDVPTAPIHSEQSPELFQSFNANIQSAITFKNPYHNITPEQESCFRLQMKLNESNYDGFSDYQAAYNLRAQHIEQACRQNKEYKKQFIERINYTLQRFLDCNCPDLLTRLDARLNGLNTIVECPLDPPFEFVCQNAAYEFIARYFDSNGALVSINDDPELLWSIRTLANTRLCGTAYGHWAIANTDTESDWGLVIHNIQMAFSNLCRGIRCATGLVPTPSTILGNKDNKLLRQIIQWCKQEQWDLVVHDNYHRPGIADNPEFICKCITLLRQQNLNKYKINKIADQDPLWQSLSEQAKKIATNSPEKRQLLSLYFRLRHDLRLQGNNPDELEMSLLAYTGIQINQKHIPQYSSPEAKTYLNDAQQEPKEKDDNEQPPPAQEEAEPKNQPPTEIPKEEEGTETIPLSQSSSFSTSDEGYDPFQRPPNPPELPSIIPNNPNPETDNYDQYRPDNPHKLTKEQWDALMKLFKNIRTNLPENFTPEELPQFIQQVLTEIKKIWPACTIKDINWQHLIRLEVNRRKKLTGYHTTSTILENLVTKVINPCKHGIYKAKWAAFNKTKDSSMFPDKWNLGKVILSTLEAFINAKKIDSVDLPATIRVVGEVENIILQIIIEANAGIIKTCYPLLEGDYSCCFKS